MCHTQKVKNKLGSRLHTILFQTLSLCHFTLWTHEAVWYRTVCVSYCQLQRRLLQSQDKPVFTFQGDRDNEEKHLQINGTKFEIE